MISSDKTEVVRFSKKKNVQVMNWNVAIYFSPTPVIGINGGCPELLGAWFRDGGRSKDPCEPATTRSKINPFEIWNKTHSVSNSQMHW